MVDPSKWPQDLIYYAWSQNLYPSDNWKCPKSTILSFLGSCNYELQDFPYLVNHRSYKVGWPLKMTARFDLLRVVSDIYTPQASGSVPKIQFFAVWRICKEEIAWFSYLMNCRSHNDSVQSFVFLFTHFLTFICFLSIATCFDYLVTVCKLFLPISTYLLIVPARFFLFVICHWFILDTRLWVVSLIFTHLLMAPPVLLNLV